MAKPAQPRQVEEPEVRAYAVIPVKGGLWVARTYAIQGDRVVAYTDSEPDGRADAVGRTLAALMEDV